VQFHNFNQGQLWCSSAIMPTVDIRFTIWLLHNVIIVY